MKLGKLISAVVCTPKTKAVWEQSQIWVNKDGTPTKTMPTEATSNYVGVSVTNSDVLDAGYLYYMIEYMKMKGVFKVSMRETASTAKKALLNVEVSQS